MYDESKWSKKLTKSPKFFNIRLKSQTHDKSSMIINKKNQSNSVKPQIEQHISNQTNKNHN